VFAGWAVVLAFIALARLLFLSRVVELAGDEFGSQAGVWLVFALDALFCIGFGLSAVGLWQRRNWGRLLFLWLLGFWSGFELVGPFLTNSDTFIDFTANMFRVAIGLLISLYYFNLTRIKALFYNDEEFLTKDAVQNDHII
jgi:hypothetical protein